MGFHLLVAHTCTHTHTHTHTHTQTHTPLTDMLFRAHMIKSFKIKRRARPTETREMASPLRHTLKKSPRRLHGPYLTGSLELMGKKAPFRSTAMLATAAPYI